MDKQQVRDDVRRRRAGLADATRSQATERAGDRLLALPEIAAAERVLLYASHGDELSTDRVLTSLVARGATVLLPRVAGDDLELVALDTLEELRPGFRGVREPVGVDVGVETIDVAVVPGVAFDREGGRLGRGGGHYDRLLRRLPAATVRIGFAFALQVVDRVPRDDHDEPIDVLVTDDDTVRTEAR